MVHGKMTYSQDEFTYTKEELKNINSEISTRQKMSTSAIKKNYFNYLNSGIKKYKNQLIEEEKKNEEVTTTIQTESEE